MNGWDGLALLQQHLKTGGNSCELKLPGRLVQPGRKSGVLDKLLGVCDASGFGEGDQTRYDSAVRKACHVPKERLSIEGFDVERSGILEEVRLALAPEAERVHAELLKLNVYGEGGHFVSHRDTPPATRDGQLHLGSLVVLLPAAHVGGELTVRHRGDKTVYPFDRMVQPKPRYFSDERRRDGVYSVEGTSLWISSGETAATQQAKHAAEVRSGICKPVLAWAAFYGDCEHTVSQVKLGARISIAYQLFIDATAAHSDGSDDEDEESKQMAQKRKELVTAGRVLAQRLPKMTLVQLKDLCRWFGRPVSGSKAALIERLKSTVSAAELAARLSSLAPDDNEDEDSDDDEDEDSDDDEDEDSDDDSDESDDHTGQQTVRFLPARKSLAKARCFAAVLRAALSDPDFLPQGGRIGLPCFHLYECDAELPRLPLDRNASSAQIHLKGADAVVAVVAARMGLRVSFLRLCQFADDCDGGWRITDELISHQNVAGLLEDVCIEDQFMAKGVDMSDVYERSGNDLEDVHWAVGYEVRGGHSERGAKTLSMAERPPVGQVLDEIWMSGTGYFGNEAGAGSIYSHVAITIDVQPYDDKRRRHDYSCQLPPDCLRWIDAGANPRAEEKEFHRRARRVRIPAPKTPMPARRRSSYGFSDSSDDY